MGVFCLPHTANEKNENYRDTKIEEERRIGTK